MNEKFESFKRALALKRPFWWAMLNYTPIFVDKNVENPTVFRDAVVLPEKFFDREDFGKTLLSAMYFLVSRHPVRKTAYSKSSETRARNFDVAAKIKAAWDLKFVDDKLRMLVSTVFELPQREVDKFVDGSSTEELADNLSDDGGSLYRNLKASVGFGDMKVSDKFYMSSGSGMGDGENQENHNEAGREALTDAARGGNSSVFSGDETEVQRKLADKVAKAVIFSKLAGKEEATGNRLLRELLMPERMPWWRLLKDTIDADFKNIIQTFKRPSRKLDDYPGSMWISFPRIVVAIDVSGSIGQKEYSQFCGILLDFAKKTQVLVTFWDTQATELRRVRSESDLKRMTVQGYGGTTPNCLVSVLRNIRLSDWFVVITDGHWERYEEFLRWVRSHRRSILITTGEEWKDFFRHVFKIGQVRE